MSARESDDSYVDKQRIRRAILDTPVGELTLRQPIFVEVGSTVREAVQAMRVFHIGCILVQDSGKLVGIFTERDLLTDVIYCDLDHEPAIESVMTANPETITASASIAFAMNRMCVGGYRHIPIVDASHKATGVVSVRDIVALLVELFPASVLNMPCSPHLGISKQTDGG